MILVNVIDQPASSCTGSHVFIGPTAVDYSMLEKPRIPAKEEAMLKQWRASTIKFHARSSERWVNPEHPDRSF